MLKIKNQFSGCNLYKYCLIWPIFCTPPREGFYTTFLFYKVFCYSDYLVTSRRKTVCHLCENVLKITCGSKRRESSKKNLLKYPLILNLSRKSQYLTKLVTKVFFVSEKKGCQISPPPWC